MAKLLRTALKGTSREKFLSPFANWLHYPNAHSLSQYLLSPQQMNLFNKQAASGSSKVAHKNVLLFNYLCGKFL